jgi:hypothetical protein
MNAIRLVHLLEFIIFSSETNIDKTARNLVYVQAGKGMIRLGKYVTQNT